MATLEENIAELELTKQKIKTQFNQLGVSTQGVQFRKYNELFSQLDKALPLQTKTVKPSTTSSSVYADEGYKLGVVNVEAVTSEIDSNIQADNIKSGVTILGVKGTFEGEGTGETTNVLESYNVTMYTDENGYNVLALNTAGEHNYVAGQMIAGDNSKLYLVNI